MVNNENVEIRSADGSDTVGGKSKIFSLIGLVLLISSVACYAFYTRQLWSDYSGVSDNITAKQAEIVKLNAKLESFKSAEKAMDVTTEVQKTSLLSMIPVGVNQDKVIEDLLSVAESNNITLRSVSFGLSDNFKENLGALKINAIFEGNYSDLINFLKGLEDNARLLKVTSISVQVSNVESLDMKKVTFSLSMDAFYQS